MAEYFSFRVLTNRLLMGVMDWPGEGMPVVFIHAITSNGLASLRLGRLLLGRHRLIAPDLRGRGQSDMPFGEYGISIHVRDVISCLDHMGIGNFVVAGHSFGAMISLNIAASYPDRVAGLMLIDGGSKLSPGAETALTEYYRHLTYRYPSIDQYVERFRRNPTYQPWTSELDALVRSNLMPQPNGTFIRRVARYVINADLDATRNMESDSLMEIYAAVRCPVLILRAEWGMMGSEDQVLNDDTLTIMRESLSSATMIDVVTILHAGHTSVLTIPSELRDQAILKFLNQFL